MNPHDSPEQEQRAVPKEEASPEAGQPAWHERTSDRRAFLKKAYGAAAAVGLAHFFEVGVQNAYAVEDCQDGVSDNGDTCGGGDPDYCPGGMDQYDECAQDGGEGDECPGGGNLADRCTGGTTTQDECGAAPSTDECNPNTTPVQDTCAPPANPDECVNGENGDGLGDTCVEGGSPEDECPGGIGGADKCVDSNDGQTDLCPDQLTTNDTCTSGNNNDDQCNDDSTNDYDVCPDQSSLDACNGPTTNDKCESGDAGSDLCGSGAPAEDVCGIKYDDTNDVCADGTVSGGDEQ